MPYRRDENVLESDAPGRSMVDIDAAFMDGL